MIKHPNKHQDKLRLLLYVKKITNLHFRGENQRIDFSVSVKFTDVTQPALPQYAEYPVIEAKFPRDFFYPFVSSTVGLIFYSLKGMYA